METGENIMEVIQYYDFNLRKEVLTYVSLKSNLRKFTELLVALGFAVVSWSE
jgi:hypothetical protein